MSREGPEPIDLPAIALPTDEEWKELFPSEEAARLAAVAARRAAFAAQQAGVAVPRSKLDHATQQGGVAIWRRSESDHVKVAFGCPHWAESLGSVPLARSEKPREITTVHGRSDVDFSHLRQCEHALGTVLRTALESIESWGSINPSAFFVLVRCLAVVMAKRLDREHRLWHVVLDWIVACIEKPSGGIAWMVGMEFLSQLHIELDWNLKNVFPQLIERLGDLDDTRRFPNGLSYCLDVDHPQQRFPAFKPRLRRSSQPDDVASFLRLSPALEKVLECLDYESVANLRATCQSVRDAIDGLGLCFRLGLGADRKADLWLRARPCVSHLVVAIEQNDRSFTFGVAVAGERIYFPVTKGDKLCLAAASISQAESRSRSPDFEVFRTAFDKMAYEEIYRRTRDLTFSGWGDGHKPDDDLGCGVNWSCIEGTTQDPVDTWNVELGGRVVATYRGNLDNIGECTYRMKASRSKETVFIMFCGQTNATSSPVLLDVLDVRSGRVTRLAAVDDASSFEHLSWQCVSDDFVIAQLAQISEGLSVAVWKAFARLDRGEFVSVGERRERRSKLETIRIRDGLAVWREVTATDLMLHHVTETSVNILDVRPAALARIVRNGENVFEMSKVIRVPGNFKVRPFQRGFFAYQYCKDEKLIKLRVVDLEETVDDRTTRLVVWKEQNDGGASTSKKKK